MKRGTMRTTHFTLAIINLMKAYQNIYLTHPYYFYEYYKATYKIWFGKLFVPLHKSRESYLRNTIKIFLTCKKEFRATGNNL